MMNNYSNQPASLRAHHPPVKPNTRGRVSRLFHDGYDGIIIIKFQSGRGLNNEIPSIPKMGRWEIAEPNQPHQCTSQ